MPLEFLYVIECFIPLSEFSRFLSKICNELKIKQED